MIKEEEPDLDQQLSQELNSKDLETPPNELQDQLSQQHTEPLLSQSQQQNSQTQPLQQQQQQQMNQERIKKRYSVITPEVRKNFIDRILQRQVTIRAAALEFGIKFSTAKAILQIFKKEGRYTKKQTRITKNKSKETMKMMPIVLKQIENTSVQLQNSNNPNNQNSDNSNTSTQATQQQKQPKTYTVDHEMKKTIAELVDFLDQNSLYIPLKSSESKIFKYNHNLYSNITINNHLNPFKSNDFNTCINVNTPYNQFDHLTSNNNNLLLQLKTVDIEGMSKKLKANEQPHQPVDYNFSYNSYFQTGI